MFDSFTKHGRIRNILKLLADERKVILEGPLSDLNRIVAQREKIVTSLTAGNVQLVEADINAIRNEAGRNQNLLKASLSGMQAAKTLLSEQRRAAETMGTYTDSGARLEVPQERNLKDKVV